MCYMDICDAINEKMEINKKRKWGKVNEQGYVKHDDNLNSSNQQIENIKP